MINMFDNFSTFTHEKYDNEIYPADTTTFWGYVDEIKIVDEGVVITGWSLYSKNGIIQAPSCIFVAEGNCIVGKCFPNIKRQDVTEHYEISSDIVCGFRIKMASTAMLNMIHCLVEVDTGIMGEIDGPGCFHSPKRPSFFKYTKESTHNVSTVDDEQALARVVDWVGHIQADGFYHLSQHSPYFALEGNGGEELYDSTHKREHLLTPGTGLLQLLKERNADCSAPALEFGCGAGSLTLGLAAGHDYPLFLATDKSLDFLKITRNNLSRIWYLEDNLKFVILDTDDINICLPPASFSLIALQNVLHHVLNVEKFISAMSKAIVKGGFLAFNEPCRDGRLMVAQLILMFKKAHEQSLPLDMLSYVDNCLESIHIMTTGAIDKQYIEDKNLIVPSDIFTIGQQWGFEVEFIPNRLFEEFADQRAPQRHINFSTVCDITLHEAMHWPEELIESFKLFAAPCIEYLDECFKGVNAAATMGIFLCKKN